MVRHKPPSTLLTTQTPRGASRHFVSASRSDDELPLSSRRTQITARLLVEQGGAVADVLLAFERFIPASDTLAHLAMMAPRLVLHLRSGLRRI